MLYDKLNNDLNNREELEVTDNIEPSPVSDEDPNIVTARTVYNTLPNINDSHGYTSETTLYAPITKGNNGNILQSDGTSEPKWVEPSELQITTDGKKIEEVYAQKAEVIKVVMDALKDVIQFDYEIVNSLPETGEKGKLYLLLNSGTESNNLFDKYMWVEETSSFEKFGANTTITNFVPLPTVSDGNLAVLDGNGKLSDSGIKVEQINKLEENSFKKLDIILTSANWSNEEPYTQNISVTGVTKTNVVIISPEPISNNIEIITDCGIIATAQDNDIITFTAFDKKPETDIKYHILVGGEG